MELASSASGMPFPKNPRDGQRKLLDKFVNNDEVTAKLPTGYGKTLCIAGGYAIKKWQGKANRLLVVVPRINQANQAGEEIPRELKALGYETKSINVGMDTNVALQAHRKNSLEVFVVTIQSLTSSASVGVAVNSLLQTGQWMLAVDECHHYSNGVGAWSTMIQSLSYSCRLVLSATPKENDIWPEPDPDVLYIDAQEEGAVKELQLNEYEYVVDVLIDGELKQYKTSEISEEFGTSDSIDEKAAKKKMRWSPKYISPLVSIPAQRMLDNRLRGIKSQMLIQCMSVAHAEMVCKQVETLLPALHVDWVGTGPMGRSPKENERIIRRFCPPKDRFGKRNWDLDVLVNVGIAGEGLDSVDVTEVVLLTPASINTSLLQCIGRAARVMNVPEGETQPVGYINCDTDSELAFEQKWTGRKVMGIFDGVPVEGEEVKDPGDGFDEDYVPIPDEPFVQISHVQLENIRQEPGYEQLEEQVVKRAGLPEEVAKNFCLNFMKDYVEDRDSQFNQSSIHSQLRSNVDAATGKLSGLVIKKLMSTGARFERSLPGDIKRRIRTQLKRQFGPIDHADEKTLRDQYACVKELEQRILNSSGIEGFPSWLR
jgi:superfamily II DNA or RNA helicase